MHFLISLRSNDYVKVARDFHIFTLSRIFVAWKNPHYNNIIYIILYIMAKNWTHIFVWKCESVKADAGGYKNVNNFFKNI